MGFFVLDADLGGAIGGLPRFLFMGCTLWRSGARCVTCWLSLVGARYSTSSASRLAAVSGGMVGVGLGMVLLSTKADVGIDI